MPALLDSDPSSIGPYSLIERLGIGGMGVVYRAKQIAPVQREVAIKIISANADSSILSRFDVERQALATMNHPFIARLYDAGITDDAQPYFVMELVRGESIIRFCDARRLSVPERIGLAIDVCQGLDHAHRSGSLHRDIKPENVLVAEVDGRFTPKLIDFGIAKALENCGAENRLTRTGQFVGTPGYMSPERIWPELGALSPACDVYSLGVLLFELLIGVLPYPRNLYNRFPAIGFGEEGPPTLRHRFDQVPDTQLTLADLRGTDVPGLRAQLSTRLDAVVSKAMAQRPAQRYKQAGELADDLKRYLDGARTTAGRQGIIETLQGLSERQRRWGREVKQLHLMTFSMMGMFGAAVGTETSRRLATRFDLPWLESILAPLLMLTIPILAYAGWRSDRTRGVKIRDLRGSAIAYVVVSLGLVIVVTVLALRHLVEAARP